MNLKDMLKSRDIDLQHVLVLRNRPTEPELKKALPWLAAERLELFTAYQQAHGGNLEGAMEAIKGVGYVASFIGQKPKEATFVGLYKIVSSKPLTYEQFWKIPANIELEKFGMKHWYAMHANRSVRWFNLVLHDFYKHWRGKLVVGWPPPERSWWRRAHRNDFPIVAVHEESAFDTVMVDWDAIDLTWEQLRILPKRLKDALSQWRGIYYIFDTSDKKGYVGSASGENNLLGRWLNYASRGHGGNRLLRPPRDPRNYRFTILQRVSPDMAVNDVTRLESTWKERLHTRAPFGLNDN
ncbi:MAG: GIY-YIG nuclease family protein [Burkholderiales bacterium]